MNKTIKSGTLALVLKTAVIGTLLNLVAQSAHALTFDVPGLRTDGDEFNLSLTTEDTLTTATYPSHNESNWSLPPGVGPSPAYTFTGYRVTSVTGTYTENGTEYPVVGLLPAGSIVSAAGDQIPHSPTDNLYNPNGGFAPDFPELPAGDTKRIFSFGGIAFNIDEGTGIEPYQFFARSDFDSTWSNGPGFSKYAGCPGSCVGVSVPEPITILGSATALGFAAFFKRKLKTSK